jgi:hypothetical protein
MLNLVLYIFLTMRCIKSFHNNNNRLQIIYQSNHVCFSSLRNSIINTEKLIKALRFNNIDSSIVIEKLLNNIEVTVKENKPLVLNTYQNEIFCFEVDRFLQFL